MSKIRGVSMNSLSAPQAAYLAGLLDGEGTITVSRQTNQKGMLGGFAYRPYVAVSNTDLRLLEWCQRTTGFGHVRKSSRPKAGHKQGYAWEVWSQKAGQLLRAVLPYLVIKRGQSELLLSLIESTRDGVGRSGLTAQERELKIGVYESVKILNKRGCDV